MTMIILNIVLMLYQVADRKPAQDQGKLEIKVEALQKLVLGLLKQSEGK